MSWIWKQKELLEGYGREYNIYNYFYFLRTHDAVVSLHAGGTVKKFFKGLMMLVMCILWLIMLPIIWLYDRIFGDWKK